MKVKILSKSKNAISFEIADTTPAFANALRRAILNKVKVLAIEKIRVNVNTSALYNEVLAHRIGLIPLTFERDAYEPMEECTCKGKGCTKCQVTLVLKKKGPATVYAKDFKSTDEKVQPVDGNILIVKILEHQEVDLEAVARLGSGSEHARWQPAIVGYQQGEKDKSKIVITVESISGLSPQEIVVAAAELLGEQLEQLSKQI